MNVLDLFCGAGGAARGYALAGHTVIGVDTNPALEADYLKSGAAGFLCMDALEAVGKIDGVDFYHGSPPCQLYSGMSRCRPGLTEEYPDLVPSTRDALDATGKPWVIENVQGAPLLDPVTLCSFMFGRRMYRHRLFEAGGGLTLAAPPEPPLSVADPCPDDRDSELWDVLLNGLGGRRKECGWPHPVKVAKAGHWKEGDGKFVSPAGHERRGPVNDAMDIHWVTRREDVAEAIPPCFTRWIGGQLGS